MNTLKTRDILSFIVKMIRPFKGGISVMFFVAFYWAVETSLGPYVIKILLDRLAVAPPEAVVSSLMGPAIFYIVLAFGMSTAWRMYDFFVTRRAIPSLREKIANEALEYLVYKSHTFYQNHLAGSLAKKTSDLLDTIPNMLDTLINKFFSHLLAVSIAIYTLWQVNYKYGLCLLLWAVFFLGSVLYTSRQLSQLSDDWSEEVSTTVGKLVDIISGILSVKLFARRHYEKIAYGQAVNKSITAEKRLRRFNFWIWLGYGYSFVINLGFNLYFLIQGRANGAISVGDFALVLTINLAIVEFLWRLGEELSQFSEYWGKTSQALRMLLNPDEIKDRPHAKPLVVTTGEIVFDHVTFHYKGASPLFEDKTLTIPGGQKVGLVGYSGSGKSTFVNLILRLFEVSSGRILIDGQDIQEVSQSSLWAQIGMIPQDPVLFHRTLMENIRYGRLEATDEEVYEAAKKASAHDFIMKLPENYDSLVGERGVKVSGGQRQRIAIARAILKNAPILILDEATSQLDSLTEQEIQASLWQLMQGKTTIVVAHRLSTLLNMDRILVFDKGQIVEDGRHQDLLSQDGLYKTLWSTQVGGFLPEQR